MTLPPMFLFIRGICPFCPMAWHASVYIKNPNLYGTMSTIFLVLFYNYIDLLYCNCMLIFFVFFYYIICSVRTLFYLTLSAHYDNLEFISNLVQYSIVMFYVIFYI
jgi:hypothetical protein